MKVTSHVAQNDSRPGGSAVDERTTRYEGYRISQRKRKRIEECFGWLKTVALLRKIRHRGLPERWTGSSPSLARAITWSAYGISPFRRCKSGPKCVC